MFRGAYTALVTPMRGGRVDDEALERLVHQQIAGGIDGLVPCGTTGESPVLSHAEHIHVIEVVVKATAGRVPVLAGAGSNATREAIELTQACKELGVEGTLQVVPYYNRPTQAGLIAHFRAIADAVALPVVLYNVPSRCGCDMKAETVAELARHPHVVGIKEATGDMVRAAAIREQCGESFALLSGDDFTVLPLLSLGGDGVISVGSNLVPKLYADLCRAAREGRWEDARALHYRQLPLSRALFHSASPIGIKLAMAMLGRIEPEIRLPHEMPPEGDAEWAMLRAALNQLELRSELPQ